MSNPFDPKTDPDRHFIWQRLVVADSEAFVAGDFSQIENDFDAQSFEGVRCNNTFNPDEWTIAFPTIESYRDAWLASSREFLKANADPLNTILARCQLDHIEINGDRALAHKKFPQAKRRTIYRLHKIDVAWKIVGFLGFLPLD